MNQFTDAIQRMLAVTNTFLWFGFPTERVVAEFGPTQSGPELHGVVAVFNDKLVVVAGIDCGPVGVATEDDARAALVSAMETWEGLDEAERKAFWLEWQPVETLTQIGTALVGIGAISEMEMSSKIGEL